MSSSSPVVRRTFRFSIDVETTLNPEADEIVSLHPEQKQFHQALVKQLLAHPTVLDQLLRSSAIAALQSVQKLFTAEFGWDRVSEQQLLQPLVENLEPDAKAYFTEESEDGMSIYYFDGYQSIIKGFNLNELS